MSAPKNKNIRRYLAGSVISRPEVVPVTPTGVLADDAELAASIRARWQHDARPEATKPTLLVPKIPADLHKLAKKFFDDSAKTSGRSMIEIQNYIPKGLCEKHREYACAQCAPRGRVLVLPQADVEVRATVDLKRVEAEHENTTTDAAGDMEPDAQDADVLKSNGASIGGRLIGSADTREKSFERSGKLHETNRGDDFGVEDEHGAAEDDYGEDSAA
jgi:hypothetical protein